MRTRILAIGTMLLVVAMVGSDAFRGYAAHTASLSDNGITLDPAQFQGDVRKAYEVARHHPELLAQLHCYCGCEQHDGHKSLLDCYRSDHATACDICVGEALTASQLAESGTPIDQIREALRQRYAHGS